MTLTTQNTLAQEKTTDVLGRAIEYFQARKFHEALIIFCSLDKRYALNPRFKGYMGVCYYHDWDYSEACSILDSIMSQLVVFAPQERSVYYYADAESHFFLRQYTEALPLYYTMLQLCHDNEKGDVFYRMGFCSLFLDNKEQALEYFKESKSYYQHFNATNPNKARIAELKHIIKGLERKI